jgi:hypothetical protein
MTVANGQGLDFRLDDADVRVPGAQDLTGVQGASG